MPSQQILRTQVLVVGGGTGGTAAAIQAARQGVETILVSEGPWLGGMLTSAGVCAPDGNELTAFQTGLWGSFLRAILDREPSGVDHGWVSFFTYQPHTGASIFADWVAQLPHLQWIQGYEPQAVFREGDRITGVAFDGLSVYADLTLDGTELGDLLALGEVPHRLGWELQSQWQEPSAPLEESPLTQRYPVQAPTWVFYLQSAMDPGAGRVAPPSGPSPFQQALQGYSPHAFIQYGAIPHQRYMINWPQHGNDYAQGVIRLFESAQQRQAFLREAHAHSQQFAQFLSHHLEHPYELADSLFPSRPGQLGGGAFALHPYYRESRRLVGMTTVIEQDLLPQGAVAPLPRDDTGQVSAIAIGNYANDHHYPSGDIPLAPKSMRWGGRWTGTAFTIPYGSLVPKAVDGLLVCEKNISVSHMANGATRLQPLVLGIGQAAGMAAALAVQQGIQPRALKVRSLQNALLNDALAPAAVVPFYNLAPHHPDWKQRQIEVLEDPSRYPATGNCPDLPPCSPRLGKAEQQRLHTVQGRFERCGPNHYQIHLDPPGQTPWSLVTLHAQVHDQLQSLPNHASIQVQGWFNPAGGWIRVHALD